MPKSPYIVSLLGMCTDFAYDLSNNDSQTAMIVPFKAGGSLRTHLDERSGNFVHKVLQNIVDFINAYAIL